MLTWDIKRIEALRWRLMVRCRDVVIPAYNASVDRVHELGEAWVSGEANVKLIPVSGSRLTGKTVRRHVPSLRGLSPLKQLAAVAAPSEEKYEAGDHFLRMRAWRDTYLRRIAKISDRLLNRVFEEGLVTRRVSPRVLKINGRYYPIRWGRIGFLDRLHLWWPDPRRENSLIEIV